MLIHRVLGQELAGRAVTVFASDIDLDALGKAKQGVYSARQLAGMEKASLERFFVREDSGYRVCNEVKALVRFSQFDLMKTPMHMNLDLILCRNVMIYFSKESQQQIHMNFHRALRNGGYLITGKSEVLSGEPSEAFSPVDHSVRVYQKQQTTPTAC
jgi:chemotaxis protein methyltransferase CheR